MSLIVSSGLYKNTDKHCSHLPDASDRQLMYYEQYGNGNTRNYTAMALRTEVNDTYRPDNPNSCAYQVPRLLVDNASHHISIYTAAVSEELLNLAVKGEQVWMCVFPQFFDEDQEDGYLTSLKKDCIQRGDLTVIPTSSSRTVLDVASKAMVKMHCPYLVSRFDRRLGKGTIQHCVSITRELKEFLSEGRYSKFAILPDSIGVTFNQQKGWGYIIRESVPFPPVEEAVDRTMIPMFALYGSDVLDQAAPVIITQMVDRAYELSGSRLPKKDFAQAFVLNEIIFPLIDFFTTVYREKGILLELHGQNTLIEMDAQGLPTRIVHRDLDNAVDIDIRAQKQLGLDGLYEGQFISRSDADKDPGSEQSLVFDKSIGRMNLDKLAESMEFYYGISQEELEKASAERFQEGLPEFKKYFPADSNCVYNYSSTMKEGMYNYYDIVKIDDKPRWRPG